MLSARDNVRHVLTLLTQDLRQIEEMRASVKDEDVNKFDSAAETSRRNIHDALRRAKIGKLSEIRQPFSVPLDTAPDV